MNIIVTLEIESSRASLRAIDHASHREWFAPIDGRIMHIGEHPLFARANLHDVLGILIARKMYHIHEHREHLIVSFTVSMQTSLGQTITDTIDWILDARTFDAPIDPVASIVPIVPNDDLTRANELMAQIVARYGPISAHNTHIARAHCAAEVSGKPIVFKWLGCDHPGWLRSVIRYVNLYDTSDYTVAPFRGGNHMRDPPINFAQWLTELSGECRARVLVLMPIDASYDYTCPTRFNVSDVSLPLDSSAKCQSPIIVFGNPFASLAPMDKCITRLIEKLRPWFAPSTQIVSARVGSGESVADSVPICEIDDEVAREYASASENYGMHAREMSYPTHILDIIDNLRC
ncbi:MAG: hypothetical protein WC919_03565 [Candidatus Paceibacterota bacterium]|jgi:hypothetical protein